MYVTVGINASVPRPREKYHKKKEKGFESVFEQSPDEHKREMHTILSSNVRGFKTPSSIIAALGGT